MPLFSDRLIFIIWRVVHPISVQLQYFTIQSISSEKNSKWIKYIISFDRTWTAAEGPKKDVYNIGKLFCAFKSYVVPFFDLAI